MSFTASVSTISFDKGNVYTISYDPRLFKRATVCNFNTQPNT